MSTTVAEIEAKVRTLSPDEKADLIRSLRAAWLEEAQRRHREIVEGKVRPVPRERVFANPARA